LLVARLDERLELEAMLAAGLSLRRIAVPLAAVGLVIAAVSFVTGGWLEPIGRHQFRTMRSEAMNAARIAALQPRAIYQPAETLALTFDRRTAPGRVGGVFLWQQLGDGRELVMTGGSGRFEIVARSRRFALDLQDGLYVARRASGEGWDRVQFHTMAFRESLDLDRSIWRRGVDQKELTTAELAAALDDPGSGIPRRQLEAEYYTRIARAASVTLIPFLVLPLAFATKKGRRGMGILLGGIVLALFHHGINLARQMARAGEIDPKTGILLTAAGFALLVAIIFHSGRHLPSHSPIAAALKRGGSLVARLRGRAPAPRAVRRRTLTLYVSWRLGVWIAAALAVIVGLLQMVDLIERGDEFVARGMGLGAVLQYVWLRLPPILLQALPIATLAGAAAAFTTLAGSSEMVAVRAAGVSQARFLLMALPVPLLVAAASWFLAERAAPRSEVAFAAWWESMAPEAQAPPMRWFRIGPDIVRSHVSAAGDRLADVAIFRRDSNGVLTEWITAPVAAAGQNGWILHGAERSRFRTEGAARERVASLDWPVPLSPEDLRIFRASPSRLPADTARRSLEAAVPVDQPDSVFATRLERSAAAPAAPLIMLLLALPLAFRFSRAGVPWPALLYAGGGGLLFLVVDGLAAAAARGGQIGPVTGAWLATLLFALGGASVLLWSER
jgi:LPS export ABC transporter permease LptG